MDGIVNELVKLNQKDWFDVLTAVIPILLSVILGIQNIIYERRTTKLQKMIHNREWAQHLSTENKKNRINEAAEIDKRTVGYRRRKLSMEKGPKTMWTAGASCSMQMSRA